MSTATPAAGPIDMLSLVSPLLRSVRRRLRYEALCCARGGKTPFDAATADALLYPQLANQMFMLLSRTTVLEMHVARLQGQLTGETPEQRFAQFIDRLSDPVIAGDILREYPVLQRQAVICAEQWLAMSVELLQRLTADWPVLLETFFHGEAPGLLVGIEGGAGDRHCGGRSVQILTFASGERLVYKPKSLAIEAGFRRLVDWLNLRGVEHPLRTPAVLDGRTHGWIEFVHTAACQTPAEIERFYRRQGAFLALLHTLAATDFHFENIVAAGEHPILIDLEALFHHRLPGSASDPSSRELIDSVMAVRLLPQVSRVAGLDETVDFSGLGATPGRATPFQSTTFAAAGTDEMQLAHERYHLPAARHLPTLRGAPVSLADYEQPLTEVFIATYNLLRWHREALLAPDGPLAALAEVEVRFIARPTQSYAILLEQSTHPDRLRDEADRSQLFERLDSRAEVLPCLHRLIPAERADLDVHNIPIFSTRPDSRHLWDCRGQRIADFFDRSGMEMVRDRLLAYSDTDLARQLAFIRRSFASLA